MLGTGAEQGTRFYSPMQVTLAHMIHVLSDIGVPLETIKWLETERSPEMMLRLIRKQQPVIAALKEFYDEVQSVMDTYVELMFDAISVTETEHAVLEMPGKQIILGAANDFSGTIGFVREFVSFCCAHHTPRLNMSYPIGGYWESMAAFLGNPTQPQRFFSLDPKGMQNKAAGFYLTGYNRGYYGVVNDLPKRMEAFAKENGLLFTGPVYNLFLLDELSIVDPNQYLLQVAASVTETKRGLPKRARRPH